MDEAYEMSGGEALVAQGAQLMRIENDSMMSVAIQRPRNEATVLKSALAELELVPEEAIKAFYSIPYKETQFDGSVRTVKVEGLSINTAMALIRRWGNCSITARLLNEDRDGWDLEGVAIDLETNYRIVRPFRVSKWQRRRGGKVELLPPDRQLMVIQAGASKAIRNATLALLPAYLKGAYERKAREIVAGKLDAKADKKTVDAVVRAFKKLGVTPEQLVRQTGEPLAEWTGDVVADLRGLWNAINDGQTTLEESFPRTTDIQDKGAATLTPESLLGGTVSGKDDAHKADVPDYPTPQQIAALKIYAQRSGLDEDLAETLSHWPQGLTAEAYEATKRTMEHVVATRTAQAQLQPALED